VTQPYPILPIGKIFKGFYGCGTRAYRVGNTTVAECNLEYFMKAKKVLIIDDEADFGLLMKNFFTRRQYDVYIAGTLAEGMKILDEEKPDVIFLDNQLPDGYGWGKTEFILLNYPHATLNLISGLDVPITSASGFRILHKPNLTDELARMFN
jgi:CheY-like chemotaxis protein